MQGDDSVQGKKGGVWIFASRRSQHVEKPTNMAGFFLPLGRSILQAYSKHQGDDPYALLTIFRIP